MQSAPHMPEKAMDTIKAMFDFLLLAGLYIGGVFTLSPDAIYIMTIGGSAIAGSVVLAYFRPDADHKATFFKSSCSSLCGLVAGAVVTKRYEITSIEYVVAVYFFTSLLSLFFIKGLLSFTEQNASGWVISILQRVVNSRAPQLPSITQHDTAPPNAELETKIIVQKDGEILETKKEGK